MALHLIHNETNLDLPQEIDSTTMLEWPGYTLEFYTDECHLYVTSMYDKYHKLFDDGHHDEADEWLDAGHVATWQA